jgi:hypothetical protein
VQHRQFLAQVKLLMSKSHDCQHSFSSWRRQITNFRGLNFESQHVAVPSKIGRGLLEGSSVFLRIGETDLGFTSGMNLVMYSSCCVIFSKHSGIFQGNGVFTHLDLFIPAIASLRTNIISLVRFFHSNAQSTRQFHPPKKTWRW